MESQEQPLGSDTFGPQSYVNWRLAQKGVPVRAIYEIPLYSDARFVGELREGSCPYALLNPIRHAPGATEPSIILRISQHIDPNEQLSMEATNIQSFTGGWMADEVACLWSVMTGARLMAGGITREFYDPTNEPAGSPRNDYSSPPPIIFNAFRRFRLPWACEEKRIVPGLFSSYANLASSDAVALVRSARAYRDALWIAETEPEIAWLLFVSALEAAAVHHFKGEEEPEERLRSSAPKLAEILSARGGDELVREIAPLVSHLFKASTKFLKLAMTFLPEPPERRPPGGFRLNWSKSSMRETVNKIYGLRSMALHAGIPFPPPMCEPPFPSADSPDWPAPSETIFGLAAATMGAVWTREDLPMTLHMFEYLVRGVILNWWKAMSSAPAVPVGNPG